MNLKLQLLFQMVCVFNILQMTVINFLTNKKYAKIYFLTFWPIVYYLIFLKLQWHVVLIIFL